MGNVPLLAVIAAHFVKNLDKYCQQRVYLGFADDIGFLVDVKENTFGGYPGSALEIATQNLIIPTLWQEQVQRRGAVDLPVFEKQCQHLEQMRLTGSEKTRHPDPIRPFVVVVSVKKRFQALLNLVGQHILFNLQAKACLIIGLDDPFNRAVDRFLKNVLKRHYGILVYASQ